MKRLHVSLSVRDLDENVRFYSALFGARPSVLQEDYAKWLIDDPAVNFSIETRGETPGLTHFGVQVGEAEDLAVVHERMRAAAGSVTELAETTCCYARSQKGWAIDPQGIPWEAFFTLRDNEAVFGEDMNDAQIGRDRAALPTRGALSSGSCC